MTAIMAIELGDMEEVMTASQSAIDGIGSNGSNIGIIPGEKSVLKTFSGNAHQFSQRGRQHNRGKPV